MLWRPLWSLQRVHSPSSARTWSRGTIGSFGTEVAGEVEGEVEGEGEGEGEEEGEGEGEGEEEEEVGEFAESDTITGPASPAQDKYARSSATAAASSSCSFSTPRL
jgi:hypothetical protein